MFQRNGEHKLYSQVRLSELFDRRYSATQCTKRDQLWIHHPYLALYAAKVFLMFGGDAKVVKKITKKMAELLQGQAATVILLLLSRREVHAVNERVIDIIDEDDMQLVELVPRLRELGQQMKTNTFLTHESVLCHRSPNICVSFSRYVICSHEQPSGEASPAVRACGGRHLCLTPGCTNRRAHATPQCSVPNSDNMGHTAVVAVRNSINFRHRPMGRGNGSRRERERGRERGRGRDKNRNKGKTPTNK